MGDWIVVGASLLLMFLDQTTSVEPHCRTVKSISNRALHGHVIAVAQTLSLERCSFKCERKADCYSINYMLTSNSCELSKGTRLSHPKHFLPRENTVYIDNLHRRYHACVHPPCQNGGTCVALPESPGYKCLCQSNYSGDDCQVCNELPLGIQDLSIPNSAISASSFEADSPPSSARIYNPGGWRALSNDTSPYLEIRFTSAKLLIVVATQGWKNTKNASSDCWTTKYFLEYKSTAARWTEYQRGGVRRVFSGNSNAAGVVRNRISSPFHCTAVRIRAINWKDRTCMRSELYGCEAHS